MKFGTKHEFHLLDLIGDAVKTTWEGRHAIDWAIIARRCVKLAGLILCVLAMVYVLYPTQRNGWILWLGEDKLPLAHWTAVVLVGLTAVIVPLTRYAWTQGGGDRFLAIGGGFFAIALLSTVLMGTWNFYSFASSRAVATSLAATGGADARIREAERRLSQIDTQAAAASNRFDQELARTPASYATARSRILAAQTAAREQAAAERASIQAELTAARAANVSVNTTVADPRPIDRFIADAFRTDRTATGVALDLWRSLVFELAALLGVSLATTAVGIAAAPTRWLWGDRTPLGDDRAIPDLRDQPKVGRTPWSLKERVFDSDTGEEMIEVRGHRKRKGKRKPGAPQPATIETPPISLPDETGVLSEADLRVARAEVDYDAAARDGQDIQPALPAIVEDADPEIIPSEDWADAHLFGDPAPSAEPPAPVVDADDVAPTDPLDGAESSPQGSTSAEANQGADNLVHDLTDDEIDLLLEEEKAA